MKECAIVVVTYNRLELLKENIEALLKQNNNNYDILLINNASTDGTEDYIKKINNERIKYYNTGKNLGGAGGFSFGVKQAILNGYKYAWLMDDDSIPQENALNSLLTKAKNIGDEFSYMASLVYWTDNSIFPMNLPSAKYKCLDDIDCDNLRKNKIIPITSSSFVGCFVNLNDAKKVGLPIADFFIYGDDMEYTLRLNKERESFLDLDSIIIHKAPSKMGADIVTASKDRINRFFYQSRNGVYIARKNNKRCQRLKTIIKRIIGIIIHSKDNKIKRIYVLIKGSLAGLVYNPTIEYVQKSKI